MKPPIAQRFVLSANHQLVLTSFYVLMGNQLSGASGLEIAKRVSRECHRVWIARNCQKEYGYNPN